MSEESEEEHYCNREPLIDEAADRFCKNPYWRDYYEKAPDRAHELIRLEFWRSALATDDDLDDSDRERYEDECIGMINEQRLRLTSVDWKYMYDHAKANGAISEGIGSYKRQYELALAREADFRLPECQFVIKAFWKFSENYDADAFDRETVAACKSVNAKKVSGEYSESTVENFYRLYDECLNRLEGGGGWITIPQRP